MTGPVRYLALGDSYTIGEGVPEHGRWPSRLAAALRERGVLVDPPVVIARTGWTTDELSTAIDEAAPEGPFALVSLLIGVNDQYRGRPVEVYAAGFRALLERSLQLAGGDPLRVLVLSIPDWGVTPFAAGRDRDRISAEIDLFNRANREIATGAGALYVDVTELSRRSGADPPMLAADGLHPSAPMYVRWAELALAALAHWPVLVARTPEA